MPADSRPLIAFSLVRGGLLYRLERRLGLIGEGSLSIVRRTTVFICVTWLPIMILDLAMRPAGALYSNLGMNIRFLFSGPILIAAEQAIEVRVLDAIREFQLRREITQTQAFSEILSVIHRQVSGVPMILAESVILILVAYLAASAFGPHGPGLIHDLEAKWGDAGVPLSWKWYAWIGLPCLQFILLRWFWRYAAWVRLLWKVSKLKMVLHGTHPDQAGGLGFVGLAQEPFALIWFAISGYSSAAVAYRIQILGRSLEAFYTPITALVTSELLVLLVPLAFFIPIMVVARREGLMAYGRLSTDYVGEFERKWVDGNSDERMLGNSDFQSLADLGNGYDRVRRMKVVPIEFISILRIILAALAPFLPLWLTVLPIEEILGAMVRLLI